MTDYAVPTYGQCLPLTFDTILSAFNELFKYSNLVARDCLTKLIVVEDEEQFNTLGVNAKGEIIVARPFWNKFIFCNNDLKTVLMHELMHHITGDVYEMANLDPESLFFDIDMQAMNIAMDARINAFLHRFLDIGAGEFFYKFYKRDETDENNPDPFRDLLKPGTFEHPHKPELSLVHDFLYSSLEHTDIVGYKDIYYIILNNIDPEDIQEIPVLGSHAFGNSTIEEDGTHSGYNKKDQDKLEEKEGLPKELEDATRELVEEAGYSDVLYRSVLNEVQQTNQKIDTSFFKHLGFNNLFKNIRADIKRYETKQSKSAVPRSLSRSDLLRVGLGYPPFLWDTETKVPIKEDICAPIYLDVSGSMWGALPEIIALITHVDAGISHVWGFSNYVYQHTLQQLQDREIKTTHGTDFDCVVSHAVEHKFKHIVIITDGYAGLSSTNVELAKQNIKQAIVVLTDEYHTKNNYFSRNYPDTYTISEVTV